MTKRGAVSGWIANSVILSFLRICGNSHSYHNLSMRTREIKKRHFPPYKTLVDFLVSWLVSVHLKTFFIFYFILFHLIFYSICFGFISVNYFL